jgi:MFS family permease
MFILGRLVAGIGGAALAPGVMLILTDIVPREKRPLYTGLLAASGGKFSHREENLDS